MRRGGRPAGRGRARRAAGRVRGAVYLHESCAEGLPTAHHAYRIASSISSTTHGSRRPRPCAVVGAAGARTAPPPPLPSRTNWTRLVPPPVLTGHASSLPPVLTGHASSLPPYRESRRTHRPDRRLIAARRLLRALLGRGQPRALPTKLRLWFVYPAALRADLDLCLRRLHLKRWCQNELAQDTLNDLLRTHLRTH